MGKHDFNEITQRINTESYKWDYEGEGGKYLPFGVADTDFKIPKEAVLAMQELLDREIFGYGDLPADRLGKAVAGWYQKRHSLPIKKEYVCHAPGLMTGALWLLLDAFTKEGDKILIQTPVYNTFNKVIEKQGRIIEENPLIYENGSYNIDFYDLEKKLADQQVKILLICSPHNPVGRVWTKEELTRIADLALNTNTLLVSDEIHSDLIFDSHVFYSAYSLDEKYLNNTIVMNSGSKTFNIAALYTAYVLIKNEELRRRYQVSVEKYHLDYNVFGLAALIACYESADYYVDEQNQYIYENYLLVKRFFETEFPEVKITELQGTYLMWLDFNAYQISDEKLSDLFKKTGIKVNEGIRYGKTGIGFVRFNIATRRQLLRAALERIKIALQELKE